MKLTSRFDRGRLYWRTFNSNDSVHFSGLSDGWIDYGATIDINQNGVSFQLEIKWDGPLSDALAQASTGVQFHDDDIRFIDSQGNIVIDDPGIQTGNVKGQPPPGEINPDDPNTPVIIIKDPPPGGDDDGPGCFASGTKVKMVDGTDCDIDKLEIGSKVLGWNPEINQFEPSCVVKLFSHKPEPLIRITLNGMANSLLVTHKHLLMSRIGWTEAGNVEIGMELLGISEFGNNSVFWQVIDTEGSVSESVFNITTEPTHTYVACNIIVHNVKNRQNLGE